MSDSTFLIVIESSEPHVLQVKSLLIRVGICFNTQYEEDIVGAVPSIVLAMHHHGLALFLNSSHPNLILSAQLSIDAHLLPGGVFLV